MLPTVGMKIPVALLWAVVQSKSHSPPMTKLPRLYHSAPRLTVTLPQRAREKCLQGQTATMDGDAVRLTDLEPRSAYSV